MSKICEMKIQKDRRVYPFDIKEIREASDFNDESTTYVEVMSFIRDLLKLVDFSRIINDSNKTIL